MSRPLFSGLIRPNATVSIYTLSANTQDTAGGSEEAYALLAEDVPVLVSQISGTRDGAFSGRWNQSSGVMSGEDENLNLQQGRVTFTTGPDGFEGMIANVRSIASHVPTPDGWIGRKITLQWSQFKYVSS